MDRTFIKRIRIVKVVKDQDNQYCPQDLCKDGPNYHHDGEKRNRVGLVGHGHYSSEVGYANGKD